MTALALINTGPNMAAYIADEIAIGPAQWPDLTDEQLRQIISSRFSAGYEIPQPFVDEAPRTTPHRPIEAREMRYPPRVVGLDCLCGMIRCAGR